MLSKFRTIAACAAAGALLVTPIASGSHRPMPPTVPKWQHINYSPQPSVRRA